MTIISISWTEKEDQKRLSTVDFSLEDQKNSSIDGISCYRRLLRTIPAVNWVSKINGLDMKSRKAILEAICLPEESEWLKETRRAIYRRL